MMREFKFRVWDVVEERMRIIAKLDFPAWIVCVCDDKLNYQCERNSFQNQESDKFILMQSTCLKDKNGVEIYEGDIVKDQRGNLVSINVVKYREDKAKFTFNGWDIPSNIDKWCEVIGNIYENHELLESK